MKQLPAFPASIYQWMLLLYPRRLRSRYREQMILSLRDSYHNRAAGQCRFWFHSFSDLLQSSLMERIYMARERAFRHPITFYTLTLAVVLTLVGATGALTMQQMLRRGANQPQIDMADWYAGEIAAGEAPGDVIPPGYVDLERSQQPFVIFYDEQGKPGAGTGYLDQNLPAPPAGVFDFARSHGSEKVTWQPRPGVRIATVVKHVTNKGSGFILAGRSLSLVEEQESLLRRMVILGWIAIMTVLFAGSSLVTRAQRRATQA